MEDDDAKPQKSVPKADRETRLKQALKANMAKRKAQSRARTAHDTNGAKTPEQ